MMKKPLWTKDFLGISFISFFLFIGFYILLTALPLYVLDDLHGTEADVGLVTACFLISAVLCRPFTGKWINGIGRKKLLLISLCIFFISSFLYLLADSIPFLLALRFIHGIGFGVATTATGTIVADVIPDERKGEGLGYYALFMNIAMVAGPFTGLTIIRSFSFDALFILVAILALFGLLLSLIVKVPERKPLQKVREKLSFASFFEASAIPVAIVGGILAFAYSGILSFISVYATELGLLKAASYFFVVFAAFIILSRPFTGKWFDLYGSHIIIYPAIVIFAVGMFVLSQASGAFVFLLAGGLIGLGFGTLSPSLQTMAINRAAPEKRGLATSTFFTFFDSGFGISSYALGVVAAYMSIGSLYSILSVVILLTVIPYYFLCHYQGGRRTQQTDLSA
ncbi:MFS transporter [Cytobacillus gottheilii]|uniref:MFS transporter n=1 Tax=Cytobacillus gottheilii TaxID=859144 RepID=UPI0012E8F612|nr:MFS transporter [Cytobacillus gottheilii]